MTPRIMLGLAAALAIGACSDEQQPMTGSSNPSAEFASTSGTKGINVALKGPATPSQLAELARHGTITKQLTRIDAVLMMGDEANLRAIRALPFVEAAGPDAERHAPPIDAVALPDFTAGLSTWNLDAVNVTNIGAEPTERTQSLDGTGVYVAILDTGLLPTWRQYFPEQQIAEEFARTFGGGAGPNGNVSEPPNKWQDDVNSHGTHVTSTVLGYSLGGTPINGVAPKATIIPVKVLNQNGSGWASAIAEGITYVAGLKADGKLGTSPVVINMSLGGSILDPVEQKALDYAIGEGVIIVASAGNNGEGGMGYPGAYAPVISVAATGWTHQWTCGTNALIGSWWNSCDVADPTSAPDFYIADFSSRKMDADHDLDVAAPGAWVVGPYQVNQSSAISYYYLSGTSMASPHVAGIVALMAQKNSSLNAAQAEATLTSTAIPLGAGSRNIVDPNDGPITVSWGSNATGHGLATADAALGSGTTASRPRRK